MFASRSLIGVLAAVAAAAIALAAMAMAPAAPAEATGPGCTVHTSLGAIAGVGTDGTCAFHGIPYAAPPTGDLRFRPPQPAARWSGTLQATDNHRVCPQFRDNITEEYPDSDRIFTNEDCLYLNVWTPRPDHARRPVIVWIHGGAARFGNANEPRYDGGTMASKGDAVVVNLNYRLGVFGWTEFGGIDPAYRGSGNNGLRDQIAALRWVRAHIADFGGDPANITAVGESEGAFSISALLATDHPERLFRRVVLESGNGFLVHAPELEKKVAAGFQAVSGATTMAPLRALSTIDLLTLQEKALETMPGAVGSATYFGPYVDGQLVRGPVISRLERGNARDVDVLLGTNRDEMRFFAQIDPTVLHLPQRALDGVFPPVLADRRQRMIATYQANRAGATEGDVSLAMLTDLAMRVPATRMAQAQSRWRPTYLYQFNWQPGGEGSLGAIHTAEVPFVFGTHRFTGNPGADEAYRADPGPIDALSGQLLDAWTSFARTGNPNTRRTVERPSWPAYRGDTRKTMIWDTPATVQRSPREDERALWDGFGFTALDFNRPNG